MAIHEFTKMAIAVMTAWTDDENKDDFATKTVTSYLEEDPDAEIKLVVGLINLSGFLLVKLENETGSDMRAILQDIAKKVG